MKHSHWPLTIGVLLARTLMAQGVAVNLGGKVVDSKSGTPVAQAVVSLAKAKLSATTDAQGAFSLVSTASGVSGSPARFSAALRNGHLDIQASERTDLVLSIRTVQGALVSTRRERLEVGTHSLAMPVVAPGLYLCTISAGHERIRFPSLSSGDGWRNAESLPVTRLDAGAALRSLAFDDTIKVAKTGYEDYTQAIANPVQSGMSIKLVARTAPPEDPGTVVNGCVVKMEGWAQYAGTTGGGNATPQKVTSVDELRTLAKDTVPRVLLLEGTYDLGANYLKVGSNKTFLGVGKNTIVKAGVAGFSLRLSHNVILRNFTVQGGGDVGTEGGDAVTATQAERLWFDHLTIMDGPDGILDLTQGTTNATVSWCKIYYTSSSQPHRYAMQFSSGSYVSTALTDRGKLDITMHHNWFGNLVDQRMPRHLWGRGHVFNSFYNSPGNTYCIGAGSWASILIENNYFKDVNDPHRYQDDCPTYLAARGNTYDNAAGKKETGLFAGEFPACLTGGEGAVVPGPWNPPYKYTLDEAKDVPDLVKRCAGPQ